ncbi:MAG: YceI family protein [Salibacteraceae bacterium]
MKKLSLMVSTLAFGLFMTSCGGEAKTTEAAPAAEEATTENVEAKTMNIDAAASTVGWSGSVVGGYSHNGTVAIKEGSLEMTGENLTGGSIMIDMTTMVPLDSNYGEGHTSEDLIGHLSTADFFDVANNPTALFEITGSDLAAGTISGNLTVRGKTNPETVTNVQFDSEGGAAKGVLVFDRQKYDVAYVSTMKDMVLSDDIELQIMLKAAM